MDWKDVYFSLDLVEATLRHLNFLNSVSKVEHVLTNATLQHALRRYEQLWLPLANENRDAEIVAPIDVEWLWCVHMLSPLAYRRDCRKMFNRTLNHDFKGEQQVIPGTNNAIEIWYEKYPMEGFNIIRNGEFAKPQRTMNKFLELPPSKLSADILESAESYIKFSYQVALPHFRDRKYLNNALKRYKQFLCLRRIDPDTFLTPSVDIMLLWFTHMCHPVAYARDMLNVCGEVLDNNVKVKSGRVDEGFVAAKEKTKQFWRRITAEDLMQPGTKLRSIDTRGEIYPMTLEDLAACCIMKYSVSLDHVGITGLPKKIKFFLKIYYRIGKGANFEELLDLRGPKRLWSCSSEFSFQSTGKVELSAVLLRKRKVWCFRGEDIFGTGSFDLLGLVNSMGFLDRALHMGIDLTALRDKHQLKVEIDGNVSDVTPFVCSLRLQKTPFKKEHLSRNALRRAGGDVMLRNDLNKDKYECIIATHGLVNHEGEEHFRCRVIHVPEILHSGLQVFFKNKLVATAHVIGSSHLPSPSQVQTSDVSMAYDPELGERAMLIRNHAGDWGLCVARWVQDKDSYLDVRFMKLAVNRLSRLEVRSADVEFQSFNANLYSGKIDINPVNNMVAENLATLWAISVLYVLCAPPDPDREMALTPAVNQSDQDEGREAAESTRQVYTEERNCQMLLAAGLNMGVPNNKHILTQYGSLTTDILIDAQDVTVEEQKTDKDRFKKEIKQLKGDIEHLPRKRAKKKKLKHADEISTRKSTSESADSPVKSSSSNDISQSQRQTDNGQANPKDNNQAKQGTVLQEQAKKNKEPVTITTKRLKRKQTSNLDDELTMSDDSISKEDLNVKTKVVTDKLGRRHVLKKQSNLEDEIAPDQDSIDEAEKEEEEFQQGKGQLNTNTIPEAVDKVESSNNNLHVDQDDIIAISREETTLIKDIVAKRKASAAESSQAYTNDVNENKPVVFHLGENDSSVREIETDDKSIETSREPKKKKKRKKGSHSHSSIHNFVNDTEMTPVEQADIHRKRKSKKNIEKSDTDV